MAKRAVTSENSETVPTTAELLVETRRLAVSVDALTFTLNLTNKTLAQAMVQHAFPVPLTRVV